MTLTEEIQRVLALSELATPGEWRMYGGTNHGRVQTDDVFVCDGSPPHFMQPEDAKLIAAAVNAWREHGPTIAALAERLEAAEAAPTAVTSGGVDDASIRKRFEREYLSGNERFAARNEVGDYVIIPINDAWAGWKAALTAALKDAP